MPARPPGIQPTRLKKNFFSKAALSGLLNSRGYRGERRVTRMRGSLNADWTALQPSQRHRFHPLVEANESTLKRSGQSRLKHANRALRLDHLRQPEAGR